MRSQLAGVRKHLLESFVSQLRGHDGEVGAAFAAMDDKIATRSDEFSVTDRALAIEFDRFATECLEGPANYSSRGVGALAFVRGWLAVPVLEDGVGAGSILADRITAAIGERPLIQIRRARPPRFVASGLTVRIADPIRHSWLLPGAAITDALAQDNRPMSIFTASATDYLFAIVEHDEHIAVAGPISAVETLCGAPVEDIMARFRVDLETQYSDGDVPPELRSYERLFGRLLRRAQRAQ
jgi:hypothetical protein